MTARGASALLIAALVGGCLRPSEDRAQAYLRVGRASAHGVTVAVIDGLAAVRALDATRLSLRARALALDIELSIAAGAPDVWAAYRPLGVPSYISGGAASTREALVEVERHYLAVDVNTRGIQRVSRVIVP